MEDTVQIVDTYNREGYLIKRSANGVPLFIPKQDTPLVQIITPDTEWVCQTIFMSKKEFKERYPHVE